MADLTTLANLKAYAQITDNVSDAVISRLISAFSTWFLNQINRGSLIQASYNEQRNGPGGDSITTIYWPIQSVTSLSVDGIAIPAMVLGQTPGYWFDSYSIFLSGCYRFRRGRGNVQLSYSAGFPSVPLDIEQAVIDQVLFTLKRAPSLGTTSQSSQGLLVTSFSQKDLAPGVQAVINSYRDRAAVGL